MNRFTKFMSSTQTTNATNILNIIGWSALLIVLFFKQCTGEKSVTKPMAGNVNLIQTMMDEKIFDNARLAAENKILRHQTDSMKHLIPKAEQKWNEAYDQAEQAAPDTCHPYLENVKKEFVKSDSLKNSVIERQTMELINTDKQLAQDKDIITMKDYFYSLRGDTIRGLQDDNKLLNKKVKRTKAAGILASIGSFFAGVLGGRASSKISP